MSHAGVAVLIETVRVCGLDSALSAGLRRWRKPNARYDPARILAQMAISLALGGTARATSLSTAL